jgi:C-terminal processing protease CtpA/Prc
MRLRPAVSRGAALFAAALCLSRPAFPQQQQPPTISNNERARAQDMLKVVAGEVKKHYYDPNFHGQNWDALITETQKNIQQVDSFNMALSHIAAAIDKLNDSHTFFLPPQHAYRVDYGW